MLALVHGNRVSAGERWKNHALAVLPTPARCGQIDVPWRADSTQGLFMKHAVPRKVVVPAFQLTQECEFEKAGAVERRFCDNGSASSCNSYHYRPSSSGQTSAWNLFAFALDSKGRPWDLATVYLLEQVQEAKRPEMATYHALADDLGAYRHWLDAQQRQDLLFHFPQNMQERVTYRYYGHLKNQVFLGELAASTAAHRMQTVIDFYKFLSKADYFIPEHPAWNARQVSLAFKTTYGAQVVKNVETTDLRIRTPKASDAFRETILDGGELRPLTSVEQGWLLDALLSIGNTEMYLLHWFMIATGARIQTACTLRVGFFLGHPHAFGSRLAGGQQVVKLMCGPGTLIDTKGGKNGVLQIPLALFKAMRTYAHSDRAKSRRRAAKGGDHQNQYLFLTNRGQPYYLGKDDAQVFDPEHTSSYLCDGGTVRKFVSDRLLTAIRERHDPQFHFKIHDLRATFGMNCVDLLMPHVQKGDFTLSKVLGTVQELMWHSSLQTTERYLKYRSRMQMIYAAIDGYGEQVQAWVAGANSLGSSDE